MASQSAVRDYAEVLEIQSYSRVFHEYADIWTPTVVETLLVKLEPTNLKYPRVVVL